MGIEETCLTIIKNIFDKPTSDIFNDEKLSLKVRNVCSQHLYSTQYWKSKPQQSYKNKKQKVTKLERKK